MSGKASLVRSCVFRAAKIYRTTFATDVYNRTDGVAASRSADAALCSSSSSVADFCCCFVTLNYYLIFFIILFLRRRLASKFAHAFRGLLLHLQIESTGKAASRSRRWARDTDTVTLTDTDTDTISLGRLLSCVTLRDALRGESGICQLMSYQSRIVNHVRK